MIPGFGRSEVFVIDNQYNHHLLQPSLQSLQLLFLSVLLIADFPIIRTSIGSPSPQALKPPEAAALLHRTPPALQLQQLTPLDLRNVRQTSPVGAEAWIFSGKNWFEA